MSSNKVLSFFLVIFLANSVLGNDWNYFQKHHKSIKVVPTKPRIIGGAEVVPHSVPFQVGLLINGNAFCGGSLISSNYVLTAAHCGVEIRQVEVILGAHNITETEDTQIRITGADIIVHENYNRSDYQNDIALIKLSESAPINDVIKTVTLPSHSDADTNYEKKITTSTGWGLDHDVNFPSINDLSSVLKSVDVAVMSNDECGDYYNDPESGYIYVTEKSICTDGYKNKGTCEGDSGGPLVYNNIQIGLVSIGTDLCEMCSPSIFTRVDKFLDWIENNSDVIIQ